MENVKKDFEITPVLNAGTGRYEISNYEKVKESATKYIQDILSKHTHEITDKDMLKSVKDDRTEIRKQGDDIKKARLQINDLLLGTFNSQLKELEKIIKDADGVLKAQVDTYVEKTKPVEPKVYSLTITSFDEKLINVVKDFAIKKGCGIVGE